MPDEMEDSSSPLPITMGFVHGIVLRPRILVTRIYRLPSEDDDYIARFMTSLSVQIINKIIFCVFASMLLLSVVIYAVKCCDVRFSYWYLDTGLAAFRHIKANYIHVIPAVWLWLRIIRTPISLISQ